MRRPRSPRRHRSRPRPFAGQSIVEFALISLTLMMLTFGIIDFGRAVFARSMLTNAVREAARTGIVINRRTVTSSDFEAQVVAAAQRRSPSLGLATDHFTMLNGKIACSKWDSSDDGNLGNCVSTTINAGDRLTVCADYQFGLTAPRLLKINGIRMQECARLPLQ